MALRLRGRKDRLAAFAILVATWSAPAHAQAPPPLVPPHAIDAGAVPYPNDATAEASVVVELLIDISGNVEDARIVDGEDPFASAVVAAARNWKFTPAHRGDVDVAARVRMRVAFHPPQRPTESPTPRSAALAVRSQPSDKNVPIDEVMVVGRHEEAGEISIGGSEVRQIPGAFGDAFRAIDSFPGVTPMASGVPFFFVRGAPPGNTGYFIDGIRLPLLFHVGVGPSVIQPGLIDHLDFFPANFPAEYGRVTGGVVAATTNAPRIDAPHGEANLRLFDAGGYVETPFADGRGTAMVGGRYSYTGLLLPVFAPDTHLNYWDYQTRVTWKLDDRDRISAFALGSHDYLAQDKDNPNGDGGRYTDQLLGTNFHRLDLRWDRQTSSHAHLRVAATLGIDSSGDQGGSTDDKSIRLRAEYENRISADLKLRLGADVQWDHYSVTDNTPGDIPPGQDPSSVYAPRNDTTGGIRADVVWKIFPRIEIVPGVRADLYTSRRSEYPPPAPHGIIYNDFTPFPVDHATAVPAIDPRLAVKIEVTKNVSYFSALGTSHQTPTFLATFPGVNIGGLSDGLQSALQASQGVDVLLPFAISARATAFYSHYLGLSDATATCPNADFTSGSSATNPCVRSRVDGRAYGLELLLRRSFAKRLSGWASYTLSRSTRDAHNPLGPVSSVTEIPSEYDRTHVFTIAGAYDLGKRWRAGARFFYYTGRPYSPTYRGFVVPPYDSERLPDFWRIDLRLEKSWRIGKTSQIALVFEGLNVTLNKEAVDTDCPQRSGTAFYSRLPAGAAYDKCPFQEIGPVSIPSIGLEGSF
ncbi:MAG: TonB family protein [Polyangiaceae bacterium]